MGAIIFLPLLLLFTLLDFGSGTGGETDLAETDPLDTNPNEDGTQDTVDLSMLLDTDTATEFDDRVVGTENSEFIDGQAGDDTLLGFGAADYLEGGSGNDILRGNDGSDVLGGGTQGDYLVGGAGNDLLMGNSDDDRLLGQEGDDVIYGGHGADTLLGGEGDDVLFSFMSDFGDPANDNTRPHELTTAYVLAFDELALANPEATSQNIANFLGSQGFGYTDLHTSAPDGQQDVLEGGDGSDSLFLGADDIGTGGEGEDAFILNYGNRTGDAAIVTDFVQADDVLVLSYQGNGEPSIRIAEDGEDALIISDGHVVAVVEGQAGAVDPSALVFVQAG